MAVTTDPYTNVDLAASIPEVWGDFVLEPNFPKAVLANFFTDLSEYMVQGGDTLHVPNIYTNVFTVSTQSVQGAEIDTQSVAQVDVTLTVNTHAYIAFIIGDKDLAQLAKNLNLNEKYAREIKNLLTQALEDALAALWSSLSTNVVGDTVTTLSDAELRDAIAALDAANFDLSECAFFFSPFVYWTQLGGITKYYSQYTSGYNFIMSGNFGPMDASRGLRGQIMGFPVFTTSRIVNGLQTYRNLFAHKSAFGYALQTPGNGGGRIRVQAEYQLRNLGMLTVADMIYGVGVLRENAAVVLNANNAAKTS